MELEDSIKSMIRDVPDYPRKGILFKDITPLLKNPVGLKLCIDELERRLWKTDFEYVVSIEARGFIVGSALAYGMGKGFIPVRKKGKLPYKTVSIEYELEYGTATVEMHSDSVERGSRVVIVDDLLATGGTALAAAQLVKGMGGTVSGYAFIVELSFLDGRKRLGGANITSLVKY